MDDGLSVVTVPAVQLHTSAAQTEDLKRREGGDGHWGCVPASSSHEWRAYDEGDMQWTQLRDRA